MKGEHILVVLAVVSLAILAGCTKTVQLGEDLTIEQPPAETEIVEVLDPEEPVVEEPAEEIVEQKQISVGGATDIKEEKVTMLSEIDCRFTEEGPEKFSFKMANIEEKKWVFNMLSYSQRETSDTPVVVLNALQVTNAQLMESCGAKSVQPGSGVVCDFDLESKSNALIKKSLRTGETAMGNINENTISLRTSSHAAEIMFLCD